MPLNRLNVWLCYWHALEITKINNKKMELATRSKHTSWKIWMYIRSKIILQQMLHMHKIQKKNHPNRSRLWKISNFPFLHVNSRVRKNWRKSWLYWMVHWNFCFNAEAKCFSIQYWSRFAHDYKFNQSPYWCECAINTHQTIYFCYIISQSNKYCG